MSWIERLEAHARSHRLEPRASVFYFLRHGETAQNRARICQGQTDVPLNAAGMAQARQAAPVVADLPVRRIIASDLQRVQMTIAPVLEQRSWPQTRNVALRERHFGPRQGKPIRDDHWDALDEGVETIDAFVDRVCCCLAAELHEDHVLVAAHGGVLRVAAAALQTPISSWAYTNALPLVFRRGDAGWQVEARTDRHSLDAFAPLPEGISVGDPITAADLTTAPVT